MPLHIEYRPSEIDEVLGNDGVKESVKSVFTRKDKPHAVLFTGPSGCGKTTLARIAATLIGCSPEDVQEYNSSNNRGIDTVREIGTNMVFAPLSGSVKVYIIDECHRMTKDAQNALLKMLEDTPKHVYFLLCTTDPEMLIKAIRTRCMTFEVKKLAPKQIGDLVRATIEAEGINLDDFSKDVIAEIVKLADGCPRQALILLDSVIDIEEEESAMAALASSRISEETTLELCQNLLSTRTNKWDDVKFILKGLDEDAEKIRYAVLGYMNAVLLNDKTDNDTSEKVSMIIDCFTESFMYSGKAALTNACYNACKI